MMTVRALQDGRNFYLEFPSGYNETVTAPVEVKSDYDMAGVREARIWFKTYCLKYGMIPVFV